IVKCTDTRGITLTDGFTFNLVN
ncbi:MAG: hypothetical protein K0R54_5531, partial [Clostridiaceae bacterium]|nr:hypothetical protein [Clostridiaceae bacterium]